MAGTQWPSAGCLRIFQLSSSLLVDVDGRGGPAPPADASCSSGSLTADQALSCLRRRAARLGRPARLTLIGDSRSRIVMQQLQTFLRLENGTEPEDVRLEDVPDGPMKALQVFTTRELCRRADKFCSRTVGSDLLQVEYWRRPYLYSLFVQKLWTLVTDCRTQPADCPDLVVLNSGMWYLRLSHIQFKIEKSPSAWTLKMREHLSQTQTVLSELVKETTVIWRLEEAITSDVTNLKRKEGFQRRLTTSHAFFYDLQTQVRTF